MSCIFLSHIEKDLPIMEEISQGLEAAGYDTWYFERDVLPGTSYLTQITCAIEDSDALVLIISPDALVSDQVTREVVGAFERQKSFFPVLVNITPPQLKERQPEWRHALGGTAMFVVGEGGISLAIPRIIDGLKAKDIQPKTSSDGAASISLPQDDRPAPSIGMEDERKRVTVLFTDLSGFLTMSEKLDPEEVGEIMSGIFKKIAQVVTRYDGFIEKYVGDAVMALFGVPKSHEDDPVRAIRAAREIHDVVKALSPSLEKRIGKPFSMHTGINTGLVITRDVNLEKGTHGVLGDTTNVVSRLSDLAKPDEIIVGHETYKHAERYFEFKKKRSVKVKGRAEPVEVYTVISPKEAPSKTHRLSGLRAELIGRKVEMGQLTDAVENLHQGRYTIFSIVGEAGTGKSRLVEEFKKSFDLEKVQWREGHSYGYSQNIPYFPLIDLLNRAWQIKEGDSRDQVKQKMEAGAGAILEERNDLIPYVGRLYVLDYPELEEVPPETWKAKLHEAIHLILANLCRRAPTVICIEDLHWADPSSIELLRNILVSLKYPVVFLCIYRPSFSLLTSHQADTIKSYYEIRLQDLSPTDAASMVESLLQSKEIPSDLRKFIQSRAEGNPFYLEEVINSLIETDTLVRDDGSWKLQRPLTKKDIPSTVQGVISARLDRLERETKRILQEASVIGRAFLYEILKRISDLKQYIDKSLTNLERLDLIKARSLQPELEYIFKHALTQEVVYNGLLIKERRLIHEKIGRVMEELFHDHLADFYETLAYHFSQSDNVQKAYEYLKLSGDKAAKNYANQEVIRFCQEAIQMLDAQPESLENKKELLEIHLMMQPPFLYLNYPEGSLEIFQNAEKLALEVEDDEALLRTQGYVVGYYSVTGNPLLGLEYSEKRFDSAEKVNNVRLMVQSAFELCVSYWFMCNVPKVLEIGGRAIQLIEKHHLERESFGMGVGVYTLICNYYGQFVGWSGNVEEGIDIIEKGFRVACEVNDKWGMAFARVLTSSVMDAAGYVKRMIMHAREAIRICEEAELSVLLDSGYMTLGKGHYYCGENDKAIEVGEKALRLSKESGTPYPYVRAWCYLNLAGAFESDGDRERAREYAKEALGVSQESSNKGAEGLACILLGCLTEEMTLAAIEKALNQIRHGISILEDYELELFRAAGYLLLGEFLIDADRKEEALESLRKAESLYQEMKITSESYWLARTQDALRKLESEAGTKY